MKPWIHLDTAQMPDGGGELRLMRRDTEFSIMAGSIELMNSRLSGSEEALATLAWGQLAVPTIGQGQIRGVAVGASRVGGQRLHVRLQQKRCRLFPIQGPPGVCVPPPSHRHLSRPPYLPQPNYQTPPHTHTARAWALR